MTGVNWSLLQPADVGGALQRGWDQGVARRADALTGDAVRAVLADPSGGAEQINALARLAPNKALALVKFQQQQQAHQRSEQFRAAQGRFVDTFGPQGGWNSLLTAGMPQGGAPNAMPSINNMATDGPPPISAAPPPPANWRETLGPDAVAALSSPLSGAENPAPVGSSLVPVDPNAALGADPDALRGVGAESGVTGQHASGETPMPEGIARAAQSGNMDARNRAFTEMAKIDPIAAMKIDSEMRDATLDRLEDADKAYRLAVARLPRVTDDASYQRVLSEVDAILGPLGMNIRDTVPVNYPGSEGVRQLLMQAMDAQQQLAAIDRRFSAEARVADIEADNERQDRNTDNLIANRNARTGLAANRERRIASTLRGGRDGGKGGGPTIFKNGQVIRNKKTGQQMIYYNGEFKPL